MSKPTADEITAMAHKIIELAHQWNAKEDCADPDDWAWDGDDFSMNARYMEAAAKIAATLQQRETKADA